MGLEKQDMKEGLSMEMLSDKWKARRPIFMFVHVLVLIYHLLNENIHHIFEVSTSIDITILCCSHPQMRPKTLLEMREVNALGGLLKG